MSLAARAMAVLVDLGSPAVVQQIPSASCRPRMVVAPRDIPTGVDRDVCVSLMRLMKDDPSTAVRAAREETSRPLRPRSHERFGRRKDRGVDRWEDCANVNEAASR